jgi:predicted transcriptional regulator
MKTNRTTVSLPAEQLERLQKMADQHGLSLAWLVRQAVSEFLERTDRQASFNPLTTGNKSEG